MKKFNIGVAVLAVVVLASCSNKELESRVTKLEGRLAAMEGGSPSVASKAKPVSSPSINPNKPVPEPAKKPEGPLPAFSFKQESHDFGTIQDGDVVEHTFEFTNTGEAPLLISDAKATCGCTVPDWPKQPIAVGETGQIKVRFNSRNKPGIQNKTVTLTSNTWPTTTRLRIKANVLKEETELPAE
ncbi:MAG: DUF1573 domain-containing protein [Bacteroidota bacterium]